jgi:hypothetical protein
MQDAYGVHHGTQMKTVVKGITVDRGNHIVCDVLFFLFAAMFGWHFV